MASEVGLLLSVYIFKQMKHHRARKLSFLRRVFCDLHYFASGKLVCKKKLLKITLGPRLHAGSSIALFIMSIMKYFKLVFIKNWKLSKNAFLMNFRIRRSHMSSC